MHKFMLALAHLSDKLQFINEVTGTQFHQQHQNRLH